MPKMFDPKKESGKLDPFLKILPLVRNFGTSGHRDIMFQFRLTFKQTFEHGKMTVNL